MLVLESLVVASLATSSLSVTATKSHLTEGIRAWVSTKFPVFEKGVNCGWCAAHWFGAAAVYYVVPTSSITDAAISWLAVVALAGVFNKIITYTGR